MRKSTASRRSDQLGDWSKWAAAKSNSEFFASAFKAMEGFNVGNQGLMTIGLIGSRDIPGVTLRRAQSILRWDRRPSLWSHAFLIGKAWNGKGKVDAIPIYEIPLASRNIAWFLSRIGATLAGLMADKPCIVSDLRG